jgi:hypothetical protein
MHQYSKSIKGELLNITLSDLLVRGYTTVLVVKEQYRDAYTLTASNLHKES